MDGLWLYLGAATIVLLQVGGIAALLLRNLWVELKLRRVRTRSRLLDSVYEELEADRSAPLRRQLARKEILRDIQSLELWLDLVATRGDDPAQLDAEDFEHVGIVERYAHALRNEREWTKRAAAAEVLGWTHSVLAAPPLLECVKDQKSELVSVRAAALRSLGRIRHPKVIEPLVESLDSPEPWFPPMIASILVRVGKPAVDRLCRLLADHNAPIGPRRWAAQVLGEIGHGRALMSLHGALSDVDAELRSKAAKALGLLADDRSIEALLDRLLVDPIPYVRICVAKALAQMSTQRTVEFLVEALADSEWWVRLRAVEGLAQFGDEARDILIGALHDRDPQVAREAARALEAQGFVAEMIQKLRQEEYSHEAAEFLVDLGKAGNLEPLLDELESSELDLVRGVVRVLARVGDRRAGPSLALVLERTVPSPLQARVIDAMRRVRAAEYVDLVLPKLRSSDEWVRKAAVDYLGDLAEPGILPQVLPLLGDGNPWTRESSLRLVERIRPPGGAPPEAVALLDDALNFVRAQAVRTLCVCHQFEELEQRKILESIDEDEIRHALLGGLSEAASPAAIGMVMQIANHVRVEELDQLRQIVKQSIRFETADRLKQLLTEYGEEHPGPGFRWTVATVVAVLPEGSELLPLAALSNDSNPRVRAAAVSSPHALIRDDELSWAHTLIALEDDDAWVVRGAVRALSLCGQPRAANSLRQAARHADVGVRMDALFGLGLSRDRQALRTLLSATQSREGALRLAATCGLALREQPEALNAWLSSLDDPDSASILHGWRDQWHPLYQEILRAARDAESLGSRLLLCTDVAAAEHELLRELDTNPDPELRVLAVQGFRTLESTRASGKVMSTYRRDPSPEVRGAALGFLVAQDTYGQRLPLLESALRDPVESIQVTAVYLTVMLDEAEAVDLLVRHLDTRRPGFLDAITDLLAGRMEEDVELIMDVIMGLEVTPSLMLGLVGVLTKVTVPLSDELLELLLRHEWAEVRAHALRALVPRLPKRGLDFVMEAMTDPTPLVRERAVHLLSALAESAGDREHEVHQTLVAALHDPSTTVQAQAALSCGLLAIASARTQLVSLRVDANRRVSRAASRALQLLERRQPTQGVS